MKTLSTLPALIALLPFCGLALRLGQAQPANAVVDQEHQEQDIRQCQEQMVRIHAGIKQYHADRKRLPLRLSDLVPKYCRQQDFTCPAKAHVGDRAWARRWLRDEALVDDQLKDNCYSYEFIDKPWQGTSVTYFEYKNAQRLYLGLHFGKSDSVPMLRCFMHGDTNVLNISFGGVLFRSHSEWEEAHSSHHDELDIPALLPNVRVDLQGKVPPRPQGFGPEILDLTDSYNATVTHSWYKYPTVQEARFEQLLGKPDFAGSVRFDVRGVVQLKGQQLYRPFPRKVQGIRVGQRAQKLHCLIGAYGKAAHGEKIAELRLNYRTRRPVALEITYGNDVLHWSSSPAESGLPELEKKVAWRGECAGENSKIDTARLYDFQRHNPYPADEILSLDFEVAVTQSNVSSAAPALFAVTLAR